MRAVAGARCSDTNFIRNVYSLASVQRAPESARIVELASGHAYFMVAMGLRPEL